MQQAVLVNRVVVVDQGQWHLVHAAATNDLLRFSCRLTEPRQDVGAHTKALSEGLEI